MPSDGPTTPQSDLGKLGKTIEAARSAAGLSLREIADAAGISATYLRAIEQGTNPKTGKPSRPSADALLGITRALGLDAQEVFALAGYPASVADGLSTPGAPAPARRAVEDLVHQIQDSVKGLNRRSPFMYARTLERLEDFAGDFRALASGTLRCTPEEEPHFTRLAVNECRGHLRAVSWQDGPWWRSDAGDRYLELHELLSQRQVEMTRIFIVDDSELDDRLRTTIERHVELGISTYVLPPDQVSDYYWRDWVLYDDALLRTAVATDQSTDRKTAEFTDDPGRIAMADTDFKALQRTARANLAEAERVLARSISLPKDG